MKLELMLGFELRHECASGSSRFLNVCPFDVLVRALHGGGGEIGFGPVY